MPGQEQALSRGGQMREQSAVLDDVAHPSAHFQKVVRGDHPAIKAHLPALGRMSPTIRRKRVDLPQPLARSGRWFSRRQITRIGSAPVAESKRLLHRLIGSWRTPSGLEHPFAWRWILRDELIWRLLAQLARIDTAR